MTDFNESTFRELSNSLNELNISTARIITKTEQIFDSLEKLEKTLENVVSESAALEKRVTVLEQNIPKELNTKIALLESSLVTYSKVSWIVMTAALLAVVQSIFKIL